MSFPRRKQTSTDGRACTPSSLWCVALAAPQRSIAHNALQLYHSTFCRIVVSSANALSYDWDTMDNVFYVHDFPLLKTQPVDPDPRKNPTHTQFSKELLEVMKSKGRC